MTTITVTDIKGKVLKLDLENTTIIDSEMKYLHWGWWLFSLLFFWPFFIALFFIKRKVFNIYNKEHGKIVLDEANGLRIMSELDNFNKR